MISNRPVANQVQQQAQQKWEQQAEVKEYMSAVNPPMPKIEVVSYPSELHQISETKIIPFDLSRQLKTDYPATSPNLMAHFVHIALGDTLKTDEVATSQLFYVIRGRGKTQMKHGTIHWKEGDLFTLPALPDAIHTAEEDTAFYWVTDSPLLEYLGVAPVKERFEPVLYTKEKLNSELARVRAEVENRNRTGILLSNPNFPKTLTITHTLWSLYNVLPAGVVQKPHRHNSIALDFCVAAGPDTYTLIGKELNEDGTIKDPIKAMWEPGAAFITPPGWWHSHHNESNEDAIVLPIQDAGLIMNMQVLDFNYVK
jgi:gentisate 1,2-dioxygenase